MLFIPKWLYLLAFSLTCSFFTVRIVLVSHLFNVACKNWRKPELYACNLNSVMCLHKETISVREAGAGVPWADGAEGRAMALFSSLHHQGTALHPWQSCWHPWSNPLCSSPVVPPSTAVPSKHDWGHTLLLIAFSWLSSVLQIMEIVFWSTPLFAWL